MLGQDRVARGDRDREKSGRFPACTAARQQSKNDPRARIPPVHLRAGLVALRQYGDGLADTERLLCSDNLVWWNKLADKSVQSGGVDQSQNSEVALRQHRGETPDGENAAKKTTQLPGRHPVPDLSFADGIHVTASLENNAVLCCQNEVATRLEHFPDALEK